MKRERPLEHTDTSWKRISEQRTMVLEEDLHVHEGCRRFSSSPESNISPSAHGFLDTRNTPILSAYNSILVVSLQEVDREKSKPDSCIFALGKMQELMDNAGLSIMIEDLLQSGLIYHTLKYSVSGSSADFNFRSNLPLPYRFVTNEERFRLENWIRELRDEPFLAPKEEIPHGLFSDQSEWTLTFRLMYFLRIGHSEDEAAILLAIGKYPSEIEEENHGILSLCHRKMKLSGESLVQPFSSYVDGKAFLRREYPKQVSFMESISGD